MASKNFENIFTQPGPINAPQIRKAAPLAAPATQPRQQVRLGLHHREKTHASGDVTTFACRYSRLCTSILGRTGLRF